MAVAVDPPCLPASWPPLIGHYVDDEPALVPVEGHVLLPSSLLRDRAASAQGLLREALFVAGRVDFPTVTEICELSFGDTNQLQDLAQIFVEAMNGRDLSPCLKALTVMHELLYDRCACEVLLSTQGLTESLLDLRRSPPAPSSAGPAAESLNLLAEELWRQLGPRDVISL